jgi:hypothetical protein
VLPCGAGGDGQPIQQAGGEDGSGAAPRACQRQWGGSEGEGGAGAVDEVSSTWAVLFDMRAR